MRSSVVVLLAIAAIVLGLVIGFALRKDRLGAALTAAEAAAALRESAAFTQREQSAVRRELVDILTVRRIGRTSTEVEFTWRDQGGPESSLRTSMALFRNMDGYHWVLTSLYKVD